VYATLNEVKSDVLRAAAAARNSGSVSSSLGSHSSDSNSSGGAAAAPAHHQQSTPKSKRVSTSAAGFAALAAAAAKAAALEGASVNKVGTRRSNSETAGRWAVSATNALYAPQPANNSRNLSGVASTVPPVTESANHGDSSHQRGGSSNHGGESANNEEDTASAETDQVSSSDDESDDDDDDDDDDERNDARALAALRLAVLEARLKVLSSNNDDNQSGESADEESGGGAAVGSSSSSSNSRNSSSSANGSGGSSSGGGGGGGTPSPEHARYGSAGAGPVVSASDRKRLAELRAHGDGSLFAECVKIARLLARSRHAVCYTGAGISTGEGANLPTIRGKLGISASQLKEEDFDPASISTLRPTRAHMALVALHASGVVRFVATQNIENLHRLSGLPDAALWEAHGNVCAATCPNCGKRFLRPPASKMCDAGCWNPAANAGAARRSWRTGMLKRNVLSHYGARVSKPAMALAHVDAADVSLIVGSSLSVQPFAKYAAQPRKLAIVNLERTKLHEAEERAKKFGARVLGEPCDIVLDAILLLLGVPYAWSSSSQGEGRCAGDMPAVPANLPAFLEHGEDSLDVAAIFMGGRRAYNKPRSEDGQDGAGGGGGGSARKPNRGRAPRVRLTAEVRQAGSDSGRSRRARWAALAGEGKEDEEIDALSSVDEGEEDEVEDAEEDEDVDDDVGDGPRQSHSRRDLQRLEEFESSTEEEDDDVLLIGDDDEEVDDDVEDEEVGEDEEVVEEGEDSERKDWNRQSSRNRRRPRSSPRQQPRSGNSATGVEGRSRSSTRGMASVRGHSSSSSSSRANNSSHHSELMSDTAQPAASVSSSTGGFVGFVKSVMPWG